MPARFSVTLSLMLFTNIMANAQNTFDFSAGIGFYELTNAGVCWNYSKKSSVGAYIGTNFQLNDKKLRSYGLSYKHIYLKPLFWKIQPGFAFKPQYWTQDDSNYHLANAALLCHAVLYYPINDRLGIDLEGGGVLNYSLETERKQNTTVGSPRRWNGNLSASIFYRLTNSSK